MGTAALNAVRGCSPPLPPSLRQVIAHMMPDLPNVGWERDIESFREFFENPAFRTDGLKVGGQGRQAAAAAGAAAARAGRSATCRAVAGRRST